MSIRIIHMGDNRSRINRIVLLTVFVVYLIFNAILLMRHELWRDEANVWLIGRDMTPLQLFREIKYQGHPCLWYLLVMPFARSGLSCRMIGVISYTVMATAAGMFLLKAPISLMVKFVTVLSPVFTYYYSVIARNYCLAALLILMLAGSYAQRNEKTVQYGILLGLLVQTDTIVLPTAGLISFAWLCETIQKGVRWRDYDIIKRVARGIWIPLASLFLWIVQFYQVSDSPVYQIAKVGGRELLNEVSIYSLWILKRLTGAGDGFCILFLAAVFFTILVLSIKIMNGWVLCVLAGSYLFQTVFSVMIYQLNVWHFIMLCFTFIWGIWVLQVQMKEKEVWGHKILTGGIRLLEASLVVAASLMFVRWNDPDETSSLANALHGIYSDGENTAAYIEENISRDELIVSTNVPFASTVIAYLPGYEFYYAGTGRVETYADWSDEQSSEIGFQELISWVRENYPDREEFILLDTDSSCLYDTGGLAACRILYQTQEQSARQEDYIVYKIDL